jgi:hypothetical protein
LRLLWGRSAVVCGGFVGRLDVNNPQHWFHTQLNRFL